MTTAPPATPDTDLHLPRDRWAAHPRFPAQALLLGSHQSFRRVSARLVAQADAGEPVTDIAWTFRYWKRAMRGHEGYEEHKLYPYLTARWGLSCSALERGHRSLAVADRAVRDHFGAAAFRPPEPPGRAGAQPEVRGERAASARLADALRTHDHILRDHLEAEEALVVPALLALEPDEFRRYYHGNIHTLLSSLGVP